MSPGSTAPIRSCGRVAEAAAAVPKRRELDFPLPDGGPVFMREVADVHASSSPSNADLYGDNVRTKIERCLAVTDGEYAGGCPARGRPERSEEALDGLDWCSRRRSRSSRRAPVDDLEIRRT